jgi:hypothetical protein
MGRLNVIALFELNHPGICLIGGHMQSVFTKIFPSFESILEERLSLLLSIDVLRNRLAHQPM